MWPISPAPSCAPRKSSPFKMSAPPTPVPRVMQTTWRESCAAPIFPLAVGHGVGVVFDRDRQAGAVLQQIAQGEVAPAGDVRQLVDDAVDAVDQARQADADGGGVRIALAQLGDDLEQRLHDAVLVRVVLRVDDRAVLDDAPLGHEPGLDGRAAKIDPDGVRHERRVGEGRRGIGREIRTLDARASIFLHRPSITPLVQVAKSPPEMREEAPWG